MEPAPSPIRLDERRAPAWSSRSLDIMLDVVDSMTSADGVERALGRLARLALRATGADRCAIFVRDPDGSRRLLPAAGSSCVGDPKELADRFRSMDPIDIDADPRFLALWEPDRAVTIDDAAASTLVPDDWQRWGSRSLAFAPLRAGGETFGALVVDYAERAHRFTAGERNMLEAIANAAGVALRSARLVEQLQHAVSVERRLAECSAALLSGLPLNEMLDVVADRFASLLPATSCSIYLLDAEQRTMHPAAFRGSEPTPEVVIDDLPEDEVARIRALWRRDPRRPLLFPNVRAHPGWDDLIPAEISSGMLIPLHVAGDLLGVVAVGRGGHPFSPDEVRVASSFADQAALAIAQARLTGTLHVRLKLIEALFALSDTVLRTSDLRAALTTLNSGVCAEAGVRCTRVSFGSHLIAEMLGVPTATTQERSLIRAWRDDAEPVDDGGSVAFPILLGSRAAGVLWIQCNRRDAGVELGRAIATGLGEVASKARLRRTGERRAHALAIAAERERIARDLHDTVGQTLFGIGLKLQDAIFDTHDPSLIERLSTLRGLAAEGVADVRSAVYSLSFLHVRERGLIPSLRALTTRFTDTTGIPARLRTEGRIPSLSDDVDSVLYRTAHEALVNVERHARATGVVVTLAHRDATIELSVRDDGVGIGQRTGADWRSAAHFGMRTMARCVEDAGGRFTVVEAQPRGLVIRATVPSGRRS